MKKERVIYYTDPASDDFAGTNINTQEIPANFCYIHRSPVWRVVCFFVYYVVAIPLVWLMAKLILGLKFQNRKAMKDLRKTGCFLYGNHTQVLDAYIPSLAAFPKRAYIVASPDAVSIPGIKHLVMMLGVLPLPSEIAGYRGLLRAIKTRYHEKACIAIYPEAHIWPYYTGIRPFHDTSFRYPVIENAPVVAMVTTYRKRKGLFALCRRPGMTVTFSEPFSPDRSLPPREAQAALRNKVYDFMCEISGEAEQVEYIRYEQKVNNP